MFGFGNDGRASTIASCMFYIVKRAYDIIIILLFIREIYELGTEIRNFNARSSILPPIVIVVQARAIPFHLTSAKNLNPTSSSFPITFSEFTYYHTHTHRIIYRVVPSSAPTPSRKQNYVSRARY